MAGVRGAGKSKSAARQITVNADEKLPWPGQNSFDAPRYSSKEAPPKRCRAPPLAVEQASSLSLHAGFPGYRGVGTMNFRRFIPLSAVALFLTVRAVPRRAVCEGDSRYAGRVRRQVGRGGCVRPDGPRVDLGDAAPPAHTLHGRACRSATRRYFAGKCGDRHPCARTSTRRGPDWGCPGLPRATRRGQGSVAQVGRRHESQTATVPPPRLTGCDCWAGRSLCNRGGPRRCNSGFRGGAPRD